MCECLVLMTAAKAIPAAHLEDWSERAAPKQPRSQYLRGAARTLAAQGLPAIYRL
jgi:hypothetical protein